MFFFHFFFIFFSSAAQRAEGFFFLNFLRKLEFASQYSFMDSCLMSELIEAAKEGHYERCQQLLSQGVDVNGIDEVRYVKDMSSSI